MKPKEIETEVTPKKSKEHALAVHEIPRLDRTRRPEADHPFGVGEERDLTNSIRRRVTEQSSDDGTRFRFQNEDVAVIQSEGQRTAAKQRSIQLHSCLH